MLILRAAFFAALFLCSATRPGLAGDVTLTSRDGTVEIIGDLLSYDGEFYRVESVFGVLTIDGSGVLCDGAGCPNLAAFVAEITISGSRTIGEVLMPALVEAFAARNGYKIMRNVNDDTHFTYVLTEPNTGNPAARIGFRVNSTSEGFADLLANEADLVLSMRPVTAHEVELAKAASLGNLGDPGRSRIIALDALVPIVSNDNALADITFETLAQIFSGEITRWSELGGPDAPIAVHLTDSLSGLAQGFTSRVMDRLAKEIMPQVVRHPNAAALADAVAQDPLAIGIGTFSQLGNARALGIRGSCGMRSEASEISIKAEDYPLTAPLFLYAPARRLPVLIREFLAFARSPAAQPVVDRSGFVDLRLRQIAVAQQGGRLANAILAASEEVTISELKRMVRRMDRTQRLSLGFRFQIGGTDLDAQSRSSVEILAKQLEVGDFNDKTVVFVGFSDGEGPASANLDLARRRAEAVRAAVLSAAATADRSRLNLRVDAFGEAMPMACDDTDWGRQINRRVEVWVN